MPVSTPPVRPQYGISHAAMILRQAVEDSPRVMTGGETIAAHAALATLAALFNFEHDPKGRSKYAGFTPREIYEREYIDRGGIVE